MKNGTVRRVRGHYGSVKGMNWLGLQAVEDPISALWMKVSTHNTMDQGSFGKCEKLTSWKLETLKLQRFLASSCGRSRLYPFKGNAPFLRS